MSRQNSLVVRSGRNDTQGLAERSDSYCSECLKKVFKRIPSDDKDSKFHRDIHELIDCSNRCELCKYICNLFGKPYLEDFIARANEFNMKPVETPTPDTANNIIRLENGSYTTLYLFSREPRTAPTVGIYYDTDDSLSDANGHFDHAIVSISLGHYVRSIDDAKSFFLYMKAGTHRVFLVRIARGF